tara:strand:- start:565 stop:882 length:318 start_codon:yes stop_codon:yes gene_type:complete
MSNWDINTEEDLIVLLKEWLKQQGKTQADLRKALNASSTRMSSLIEVLEKDFSIGGIAKVAERLCQIESYWTDPITKESNPVSSSDPFGQLDLLLEEIKDDCDDS